MTKIEAKFFNFIKRHITLILFIAVTVLGLYIRFLGKDFESDDFRSFLNGWWTVIKNSDITGLANQVGNYNIPYQIIIFIMSRFPVEAMFAYKLLSVIFDVALALSAMLLVRQETKGKRPFLAVIAYSLVFCSLTVVFNSAFWAQCDSMYVTFILLAIYFEKKGNHIPAFIMLGISFAFKLQFIFILPVFLYYYISNRRVSILHFLIIPLTDIVMCLPAVFLGRDPLDIVKIYWGQTDYGKLIQMNFPNIYAFMCEGRDATFYYLFKQFSVVLTVIILGIGLCMIIGGRVDLSDGKNFFLTSIWTVFTCLMFLSSMHERYSYLLDILLILYALMYRKHIVTAVICNLVSLRGYCYYLFSSYETVELKIAAIVYLSVYAYVSYSFVKDVFQNGKKLNKTISELQQ